MLQVVYLNLCVLLKAELSKAPPSDDFEDFFEDVSICFVQGLS